MERGPFLWLLSRKKEAPCFHKIQNESDEIWNGSKGNFETTPIYGVRQRKRLHAKDNKWRSREDDIGNRRKETINGHGKRTERLRKKGQQIKYRGKKEGIGVRIKCSPANYLKRRTKGSKSFLGDRRSWDGKEKTQNRDSVPEKMKGCKKDINEQGKLVKRQKMRRRKYSLANLWRLTSPFLVQHKGRNRAGAKPSTPNKHSNTKQASQQKEKKKSTANTMDLSELVAKTQAWSCEEPVVTRQPRNRGTGELQMLVGKMIASRRFTQQAMKSILVTAWPDAQRIEVNEAATNTFVFKFPSKHAMDKAWKGRPWKLSETLLVLKKWDLKGRPARVDFSRCDIWVQVHDLPLSWRTEDDLKAILEAQFPEVQELDENGLSPESWVKFLRARVAIELNQPIPYGFWASEEEDAEWVNYKYEKLPAGFCYTCGRIGHSRSGCEFKEELVQGRYGEHSRAGINSPTAPTPARRNRREERGTPTATIDPFWGALQGTISRARRASGRWFPTGGGTTEDDARAVDAAGIREEGGRGYARNLVGEFETTMEGPGSDQMVGQNEMGRAGSIPGLERVVQPLAQTSLSGGNEITRRRRNGKAKEGEEDGPTRQAFIFSAMQQWQDGPDLSPHRKIKKRKQGGGVVIREMEDEQKNTNEEADEEVGDNGLNIQQVASPYVPMESFNYSGWMHHYDNGEGGELGGTYYTENGTVVTRNPPSEP